MDGEERWKEIEKGQEEDYFLRKHREWLEKKRSVKGENQAGESKGSLLCPRCRHGLQRTSQQQWVILQCPECGRGWLDGAVLKRLLER